MAAPPSPARRRLDTVTGRSIGFLLHPMEERAAEVARARAEQLGFDTWTAIDDPEQTFARHAAATSLLVTIGGDGTFLYGARLAGGLGIPVLGINRGRLGFLTDVEVGELPAVLEAFAAGRTHTQRRSMIEVSAGDGETAATLISTLALNDAAVKSQGVSVARLRVDADDEILGEFDCDGVVIATATGSTAYALSAGGPPVDPRVRALVVVPLAPHAVITRAVVLPEAVTVRVAVQRGRVHAAADGNVQATLGDGGWVTVRPGPELEVVRLPGSPSFLHRLRDKVHFGTPLKQAVDHPSPASPRLANRQAGVEKVEADRSLPWGGEEAPP